MPRHDTSLGAGNFPAASKLLRRYEQDKAYKLHQQKVYILVTQNIRGGSRISGKGG